MRFRNRWDARIVRIATWNINSVRLRINLVTRFLREHAPDVLCLQEIKVENGLFPAKPFRKLGYEHQAISGQKSYHGVAVLSRIPFARTGVQEFCGRSDARHIGVTLANGLELHDFYVPAGADIPDPQLNPKFAHKLAFLGEMARFFEHRSDRQTQPVVLVGDLNVAPLENDVWSHKQMLGVVSHTPAETALLGEARDAFGWTDVTRQFVPHEEKAFSWWSYRALDWQASDRGRRLDHIWLSPALKGAARAHSIIRKTRGWKQPSDHVPVMVDLDV
ncbi:MAG: exodeoxyribonuclease III [Alphaproteobacteria bacterium]|nr:exodeoxyribonuclease III [Alphaproteobacteria bacterium]